MKGDRAALAAKHSLGNVARFFTRLRNLVDLVKSFLEFAQPKFDRKLLVFPANAKLQQIPRLFLLEPALHALGRLTTVPREEEIARPQSGLSRGAFGIDRGHNKSAARISLHEETK